jgi:hypothetical protein
MSLRSLSLQIVLRTPHTSLQLLGQQSARKLITGYPLPVTTLDPS